MRPALLVLDAEDAASLRQTDATSEVTEFTGAHGQEAHSYSQV